MDTEADQRSVLTSHLTLKRCDRWTITLHRIDRQPLVQHCLLTALKQPTVLSCREQHRDGVHRIMGIIYTENH